MYSTLSKKLEFDSCLQSMYKYKLFCTLQFSAYFPLKCALKRLKTQIVGCPNINSPPADLYIGTLPVIVYPK